MNASFLFWNLQKKDLRARVARLVEHFSVDAILLAESVIPDDSLTADLNRSIAGRFAAHRSLNQKVRFYSRWRAPFVSEAFSDPIGSLNVWRLHIGPAPGLLLASVHFPSKVGWSAHSQSQQAVMLAQDLRRTEEQVGHRRTLLMGDLNMNPFEEGGVGALALNAVMSSSVATATGRTVQGRNYPFFYNPMWGCFGDRTPGPSGSHYYRPSEGISYYWNLFDQVLVRPELAAALTAVRILDSDGTESLLDGRHLPDQGSASDHLPLLFTLEI